MTETWTKLATTYGAKAAVSLSLSDEELEVLTAHQCNILLDHLRPLLNGDEQRALDFGCGSGRLTGMLHDLLVHPEPIVWAFDPCPEMLHLADENPEKPCILTTRLPNHLSFDVVFMAQVLGDPECRVGAVINEALSVLTPGGLFVLCDHMPTYPPPGRWWRFRSMFFYQGLFLSYGISLDFITTMPQGENEVTVLGGRSKR